MYLLATEKNLRIGNVIPFGSEASGIWKDIEEWTRRFFKAVPRTVQFGEAGTTLESDPMPASSKNSNAFAQISKWTGSAVPCSTDWGTEPEGILNMSAFFCQNETGLRSFPNCFPKRFSRGFSATHPDPAASQDLVSKWRARRFALSLRPQVRQENLV
jgi:hypothetical protein